MTGYLVIHYGWGHTIFCGYKAKGMDRPCHNRVDALGVRCRLHRGLKENDRQRMKRLDASVSR
jgi:hypothetical protein